MKNIKDIYEEKIIPEAIGEEKELVNNPAVKRIAYRLAGFACFEIESQYNKLANDDDQIINNDLVYVDDIDGKPAGWNWCWKYVDSIAQEEAKLIDGKGIFEEA